jgi:hypothetical protein
VNPESFNVDQVPEENPILLKYHLQPNRKFAGFHDLPVRFIPCAYVGIL